MFIKRIDLTNFRSFKDKVSIDVLPHIAIFIGPNGAGKSNILEALRYLKGLIQNNQTRPFTDMVFDQEPQRKITIEICFNNDEDRLQMIHELFKENTNINIDEAKNSPFLSEVAYKVTIDHNGVESEEIQISQATGQQILMIRSVHEEGSIRFEHVDLDEKCSTLTDINTPIKGYGKLNIEPKGFMIHAAGLRGLKPIEEQICKKINDSISSWVWLEPVRQVKPTMELGEASTVDSSGSNIVRFLNSVLGSDPDKFLHLRDRIIEVLPSITRILAPPKGNMATVDIGESGLKKNFRIENASSGIIQTLILVVKILTEKEGSLMMIEEPELHLHASSQRRLFKMIRDESKNRQFFITTHSTIFTAIDESVSTYLVSKTQGFTKVDKVETPRGLLFAKEILGHRNADLFSDECVVFVEGDSEETAFPIIAKALGLDLAAKGVRIINLKGNSKVAMLGEYLKFLKDSDIKRFIIADGNKQVKAQLADWQRENLIEPNHCSVWELEFEDCFSLETIATAVNELLKESLVKIAISPDRLRSEKKEGMSIVKILQKIFYEANLDFDKPALAEELATLLSEKMKQPNHMETEIEKTLKRVADLSSI